MVKRKRSLLFLKRKNWVLSGSILASVSLILGIGWFVFPLEISELSNRWEFWRGGVTEITKGDLHGYLHDSCQPTQQSLPHAQMPAQSAPQPAAQASECACVALIHGLGDNALTWKKVLLWPDSNWKRMGLGQSVKLLAFDLPGSGQSLPPGDPSEYRVRKQAEKIRQSLASVCPKWTLVGNSLGGWIAAWLALDWPQGVNRLLLVDSAGLKGDHLTSRALLTQPTVESMKEFQKRAYYRPRKIPDRVWSAIVRRANSSHSKQVVEAQLLEDHLDLALPTLRKPTLFLWGKEDQIIPLSEGYRMRQLIPSAGWREAPECGHLPQKECPAVLIQSIVDLINFGSA